MPTLSITLSDSAIVNGTKSYKVSDGDIQSLLNWASVAFSVPAAAGNAGVLLAWGKYVLNLSDESKGIRVFLRCHFP